MTRPDSLIRSKRPRLDDIAQALGVSRATVSNAFNRPQVVAQDLRERILSHAQSIGYFGPDPKARAMRMQALQEVAVIFHHDLRYALHDSQSVGFLRGVASELDVRGLSLQLIPKMGRSLAPWTSAFQTTADALIVHDQLPPDLLPQVRALGKPVTLIDVNVPDVPCVTVDDLGGAQQAAQHVLSSQPDVLVVLALPMANDEYEGILAAPQAFKPWSVSGRRLAGYWRALHEAGFDLGAVHVIWGDDIQPEHLSQKLTSLMSRLGKQAQRVGALCMSDRLALAMQRKYGAQLVALVGFDDIEEAEAAGLTSIRQDSFAKGACAVRLALDGGESVCMATGLVVRDT